VFNHPSWGAPVTLFTASNFVRFTPSSFDGGGGTTNTPGPRRVTLGFRVQFQVRPCNATKVVRADVPNVEMPSKTRAFRHSAFCIREFDNLIHESGGPSAAIPA
jgi:hypothetical protein